MRKISVPRDTPSEFVWVILLLKPRGGGRRENRGRVRKPGGRKLHSHTQRREWPKTEMSKNEMDTEDGGEAGTSQLQSRRQIGHITKMF